MADSTEDAILRGLQYAETRGQRHPERAVGDRGQARGLFQMHPVMYRDIQQTFPHTWGRMTYEQMLASPATQRAAARAGVQMLGSTRYQLSGDAQLSAWNTGPTAARRGKLNAAYVRTVRQGMGNATLRGFR